jgi:hypothetical protein
LRGKAAGMTSAPAAAASIAAAISTKPTSAGPAAIAPAIHKPANTIAAVASTRRTRRSACSQRLPCTSELS